MPNRTVPDAAGPNPDVEDREYLVARNEALEARVRELEAERVRLLEGAEALDREQAEALRASGQRYHALFDSIDQGFCVLEVLFDDDDRPADFRFVEVNAAFESQTGLVDVTGRTMRSLRPDHEDHWFETFGGVARTGEPVRFENEAAALGRWYDVNAFRFGDPEDRRVGVLFRDVSDRRRTDEALREAKREAEQASLAKSRFLAVTSHELRTPLQGVIGFAELLSGEVLGPMNEEQKQAVSRIKTTSWHLVSIIDEILTLSRTEAGKEEVRWSDADLARLTREIAAVLEPAAETAGLTLRVDGAEEALPVRTDPGKARQILMNLVGNAVKYTGKGEVAVLVDRSDPRSVRIHVQDTGPGIAPEDRERIFEPFTQLDGSPTRGAPGTGLGLAICRRLARLIGGDVSLESTPGVGSTFTLRLPRSASTPS